MSYRAAKIKPFEETRSYCEETGKISYKSRNHINAMNRHVNNDFRTYFCKESNGYHITSEKRVHTLRYCYDG